MGQLMSKNAAPFSRADEAVTATIANAAATSDAVDFTAAAFGGFALPAAFTGTAMTFTVCSTSGGTYQALQKADGSAAVSVVVAQGKSYPLPTELAGWPYFKFVSGSTEGGARSIIVTRKR